MEADNVKVGACLLLKGSNCTDIDRINCDVDFIPDSSNQAEEYTAESAGERRKLCFSQWDEGQILDAVLHCSIGDIVKAYEVKQWLESLHCLRQDQSESIRAELLCNVHGSHNEAETIFVAEKVTSTFIILRTPGYEEDPAAKRLGHMLVSMSLHHQDLRVINLASGHSVRQLLQMDRSAACVFTFDFQPESAVLRQLFAERLTKTRRMCTVNVSPAILQRKTDEHAWRDGETTTVNSHKNHTAPLPTNDLHTNHKSDADQTSAMVRTSEICRSCDSILTQSSLCSINKKMYNNLQTDNRLFEKHNMEPGLRSLNHFEDSFDDAFNIYYSSTNASIRSCSLCSPTDQAETHTSDNPQRKDPNENTPINVHLRTNAQVFPSEAPVAETSTRISSSSNSHNYDNIAESSSVKETAHVTAKAELDKAGSMETVYEPYEDDYPDYTLSAVPKEPQSSALSYSRTDTSGLSLTNKELAGCSCDTNTTVTSPLKIDNIAVTDQLLVAKLGPVLEAPAYDYAPLEMSDQHIYNTATGQPVVQEYLVKPSPRKQQIIHAFSRLILCGPRFSGTPLSANARFTYGNLTRGSVISQGS